MATGVQKLNIRIAKPSANGIQLGDDELATPFKSLTATLATMRTLQATITKLGDKCASPAKQLTGELVGLPKAVKDADGSAKTLMKAVAKSSNKRRARIRAR